MGILWTPPSVHPAGCQSACKHMCRYVQIKERTRMEYLFPWNKWLWFSCSSKSKFWFGSLCSPKYNPTSTCDFQRCDSEAADRFSYILQSNQRLLAVPSIINYKDMRLAKAPSNCADMQVDLNDLWLLMADCRKFHALAQNLLWWPLFSSKFGFVLPTYMPLYPVPTNHWKRERGRERESGAGEGWGKNHYYQCSKGIALKVLKPEWCFLYRVLYISVKFYENIWNGFQLWSGHKNVTKNRRIDWQGKNNMFPDPIVVRHDHKLIFSIYSRPLKRSGHILIISK